MPGKVAVRQDVHLMPTSPLASPSHISLDPTSLHTLWRQRIHGLAPTHLPAFLRASSGLASLPPSLVSMTPCLCSLLSTLSSTLAPSFAHQGWMLLSCFCVYSLLQRVPQIRAITSFILARPLAFSKNWTLSLEQLGMRTHMPCAHILTVFFPGLKNNNVYVQ